MEESESTPVTSTSSSFDDDVPLFNICGKRFLVTVRDDKLWALLAFSDARIELCTVVSI